MYVQHFAGRSRLGCSRSHVLAMIHKNMLHAVKTPDTMSPRGFVFTVTNTAAELDALKLRVITRRPAGWAHTKTTQASVHAKLEHKDLWSLVELGKMLHRSRATLNSWVSRGMKQKFTSGQGVMITKDDAKECATYFLKPEPVVVKSETLLDRTEKVIDGINAERRAAFAAINTRLDVLDRKLDHLLALWDTP